MLELILQQQLAVLAMAVLAIQIAFDSTLAQDLKKIIFSANLKRQRKLSTYDFNIREWYMIPTYLLIFLFAHLYETVKDLSECPYCTAFWLGLGVLNIYFGLSLVTSIVYAPLTILYTYIIVKKYIH